MKILVTGRHGQLARSLQERCRSFPHFELDCVGRPEVDLSMPGQLTAAIATRRPELVINAAAYTNVDQAEIEPEVAFRLNAEAAGEAAEASAGVGAAIIHVSTDYVFGGSLDRPYVESDPPDPRNVYGASKLAGEQQVMAANPRHLILRTSWVISPFGRNFVRTMIEAARTRDTLTVVADQRGKPTSALDLADAIIAIIGSWRTNDGLGGTYHVAGGGEASWCELAYAIMEDCRRFGAPAADVTPIATEDWPTKAARPANSVLDCSALERDFGIVLPHWRASLLEIVKRILSDEEG